MTHHPSRPHDDDPAEAAALARVNRLRVARGLEPIVERDLDEVRRDLIEDRDAAMIALFALRFDGVRMPDAVEGATRGHGPATLAVMPYAVAQAIVDRILPEHRDYVIADVDDELQSFDTTAGDELSAHRAVWRIAAAVQPALAAAIVADGSGAQLPGFTGPAPASAADLAASADFAAGFVYADLIDRLQTGLGCGGWTPCRRRTDRPRSRKALPPCRCVERTGTGARRC